MYAWIGPFPSNNSLLLNIARNWVSLLFRCCGCSTSMAEECCDGELGSVPFIGTLLSGVGEGETDGIFSSLFVDIAVLDNLITVVERKKKANFWLIMIILLICSVLTGRKMPRNLCFCLPVGSCHVLQLALATCTVFKSYSKNI